MVIQMFSHSQPRAPEVVAEGLQNSPNMLRQLVYLVFCFGNANPDLGVIYVFQFSFLKRFAGASTLRTCYSFENYKITLHSTTGHSEVLLQIVVRRGGDNVAQWCGTKTTKEVKQAAAGKGEG
ncbi:uncharacterized protein LOC124679062 [Lolium rigidum]|uniref:uncharacterized protein LOC124679062 n=1 Tax=Lolium rigidum TaxID=89674 RepID=UPI001F5D5735|nr:uncharacterized protein LOC124679062 [Lolium rigidum]